MQELWYKNITYEDAVELAKENLTGMVETFIAAGYYLKVMKEEYERHGYKTIWECAEAELGLKKSEASKAMSMNSKYSVDGNTPYIQEKYKQYSKSQLQEMLKMSEEQIDQVQPDMKVREIREMKRPALEEKRDDGLLQAWISAFIHFYFKDIERIYDGMKRIDHELIHKEFGHEINMCLTGDGMRCITLVVEGDTVSFLESYTGEAAARYPSGVFDDMLADNFLNMRQSGNDAGAEICFDIETEQVNTGLGEEMPEDVAAEIETDSGEISVEFDTDELLRGLDDVIDVEYEEVVAAGEETSAGLSAYGLPKTEYPPDSLLTTAGCGHKYVCFGCARECGIRQKERYCREAPLGNPYGCETMDALEAIKTDGVSENCQFINQELADRAADGAPEPCCENCHLKSTCVFCCNAAKRGRVPENMPDMGEDGTGFIAAPQQQELAGELYRLRGILKKESRLLDEYLEIGNLPEPTVYRQRIIVEALANMLDGLENTEEKEGGAAEVQQELPVLKNNDQRKQWLSNYKAWGLWYRDGNIDVNYYKFDFPDGSRLVVAEYPQRHVCWKDERKDEYHFHLLEKGKQGYKKKYDEQYRQQADSETYLVEFIKNVQKKGGAG